ncbi:hypothetical protein TNCV_1850721 [Trichonephila clavipes]|nr:hypothetical protein TNCV_1850721 [Trichonephila clavipes]
MRLQSRRQSSSIHTFSGIVQSALNHRKHQERERERELFLRNQLFHSLSVRQTGESVKNSAEIIEIGAWINGQRSLCCHKWRQVETRYLCALPVSKKSTILQQRLYDMSRHHVGWLNPLPCL